MSSAAAVPVIVVLVLMAIDGWVFSDAKTRAARGTPVIFRAGSFVVDTPGAWFLACLLLWVIFFPLYMINRA